MNHTKIVHNLPANLGIACSFKKNNTLQKSGTDDLKQMSVYCKLQCLQSAVVQCDATTKYEIVLQCTVS